MSSVRRSRSSDPSTSNLPDVQAEAAAIPLALDEAGISDLRYPITVHLADGSQQPTVATVSFAASVAADTRGVHMSRFVETLHVWRNRIGVATLSALLADLRERLDAQTAVAQIDFPLFLERTGPSAAAAHSSPTTARSRDASSAAKHACTLTTRVPSRASAPAVARSATTARTTSAAASRSASTST